MVDVALLELEGVLFETQALGRASVRDALAANGIEAEGDPEIADALAARAAVVALLRGTAFQHDDVLIDLIALDAERRFSREITTSGVAMRAGARSFVETASAQGRLGIVTRMLRADAQLLLRLAGLDDAMATVVCGDDVIEMKPSPEGHRLALSRMRRQRATELTSVIALEDGAAGISAAHALGVRCVAVGPLAPHVAMEADAYVASLEGQTLRTLDALSAPGRERVQ